MIPPGRSETLRLESRTLFNHTDIYRDRQAIERIAEFINQV
jgi:hypothetical protein